MQIKISFFIALLCLSVTNISAQVPVIKLPELQKLLNSKSDTTYVVNFWATWCKPCVAELPHFEKLNAESKDKKIKVILVSLDFKRDLNSRLKPFVEKNNLKSTVVLLDEPDYNSWIDKIDASWSGAIPATLVIKNNRKKFYEREFHSYDDLEKTLNNLNL